MTTFADTSALLAVLDASDKNHPSAKATWQDLVLTEAEIVSTNYVLVETLALVQSRLGMDALRAFQEDVVPLLRIEWIDASSHAAAVSALLIAGRRRLSLVDCVSFDTMRRLGLASAFTFDRHFEEQGFACLP